MSSLTAMEQLQASAVGRVVQLAQADRWGDVDSEVGRLKGSGGATEGGDRHEARLANEQGLALLKQGNLDSALAVFQRGATADPGDVEVQNNLAYALIQAGRNNEAVAVLARVLSIAPDRTSAWANLAEASAPADANTSVSTLKLALHFSANRARTIAVLQQTAQTSESPQFRTAASKVLASLESVPTLAAADASPVRSSTPGQVRPTRADSQAQASNQVGEALRQMLDEGRQCYERKEFSCAITSATNVLRLNPSSTEAQELKSQAEAAQAEAVQGIQIN
jgi:tetratricopeptide (TPR) repeat protein